MWIEVERLMGTGEGDSGGSDGAAVWQPPAGESAQRTAGARLSARPGAPGVVAHPAQRASTDVCPGAASHLASTGLLHGFAES